MISIKDTVKLPSTALQYMIDGLRKQSQRDDFRISMYTFGEYNPFYNMCFGCAATCTVQEIAGKNLTVKTIQDEEIRASALGFDREELDQFEIAMDAARRGHLLSLFTFFGIKPPSFIPKFIANITMNSLNWRRRIPEIEELIAKLKTQGY